MSADLTIGSGRPTRSRRRRGGVLAVAVLALLVGETVLAHDALGRSLSAAGRARPAWLGVAVVAALVSMHCFARVQRRMVHAADPAAPLVPMRRMIGVTYSANAVSTTLPGGGAASVAYVVRRLGLLGVGGTAIGFTLVASGVLCTSALGVLILAGAFARGIDEGVWITGAGMGDGAVLAAAVLCVLVVGKVIRRHKIASRVRLALRAAAQGAGRGSRLATRVVDGVGAGLDHVRPTARDWVAGGAFALGKWLADLGCLVAASRAVGIELPSTTTVLAAYVAGMTASSVALVPGGFGVIEAAMILTLHGGGVATAGATTAVLVYRLVSCVLVVLVGWAMWASSAYGERPVGRADVPGSPRFAPETPR